MNFRITDLIKNLIEYPEVDDVRRRNNAFSLKDGKITAISINAEKAGRGFTSFDLGEEATALEYLNIAGNETVEIVRFECALPNLFYADLSRCSIKQIEIPAGIDKLWQLYLHHNKLEKLEFKGACPELLLLDAANNNISSFTLPSGFTKLAYLYLPDNKITTLSLPSDITSLEILHLRNNELMELPENLLNFGNLETLYLHNNSLPGVFKEFISNEERGNSRDGIINYLKSLAEGIIINNEAKIVLIGNGNAGKTTLSHQLRKNEFIRDYKPSHGILIKEWIIPQMDFTESLKFKISVDIELEKSKNPELAKNLKMPESLKISLWDFGGQEYYHATHRLFLSSNIMYLLLWEKNTDKQDESKGLYPREHWLQNIGYYAPKNETFTIENKVTGKFEVSQDEKKYKINYRDEQQQRSIKKYEDDIEDIKQAIFDILPDIGTLGKPFPKVYDHIRKELKKLKNPVMLFDDFERFCFENDSSRNNLMKESGQIETLTKFLDESGSIICYHYKDKPVIGENIKKFVFTSPEWVTGVIYDILKKELIQNNGEFDDKYLVNALHYSINIGENKNLLTNREWIELLISFELIFEIEKKGSKRYVVPQYLPNEYANPEDLEMNLTNRNLIHSFTLNFPDYFPNSLFLRFIVSFGKLSFPNYLYWKSGLLFFSQTGKTAFVKYIEKEEKHLIEVQISDKDYAFATEILDFFRERSNEKLEVSCNGNNFVPIVKLIDNKNFGGVTYNGFSFKCSDFPFILEGSRMESTVYKTNITKKVFISYSHDGEEHKQWVRNLAEKLIYSRIEVILDQYELFAGKNMITFMERASKEADKIIVIFTPNYKLRAEERKGGVGFEYSIITNKIYKNIRNNDLMIPALRSGSFSDSIPDFYQQYIAVDFTDKQNFESEFEKLVLAIYDQSIHKKPELGTIPPYIGK